MDSPEILSLEKEIEKDNKSVEARERIQEKLEVKESKKISLFTSLAWFLTITGFGIIILGSFKVGSKPSQLSLNEFGDFLAGTLASAWALAGVFFIYVSFIGQRLELGQSKIDILYGRIEMKHTRLEMMRQKSLIQEQSRVAERHAAIAQQNTLEVRRQSNMDLIRGMFGDLSVYEDKLSKPGTDGRDVLYLACDNLRMKLKGFEVTPKEVSDGHVQKPYDSFKKWERDLSPVIKEYLNKLKIIFDFVYSTYSLSHAEDLVLAISVFLSEENEVMMFYKVCFEYDNDLINFCKESRIFEQVKNDPHLLGHKSHIHFLME